MVSAFFRRYVAKEFKCRLIITVLIIVHRVVLH